MLEPMKKPLTKGKTNKILRMYYGDEAFDFPRNIAERYCVSKGNLTTEEVFSEINQQYTKPGALLKGLRAREDLTQTDLAKHLKMTQSDISQMENGKRPIGRTVAKRIEQLFEVDYRSFLD